MKYSPGKTLASKISLVANLPFIVVIIVMGLATAVMLEHELGTRARNERVTMADMAASLVNSEVGSAVKNSLRAIAEKNRSLMALYHQKVLRGELTQAEARRRVKEIFLDPAYGRIGETGYLAGVSTAGVLVIHPKSEGANASGHAFMQKAMAMKNGYLEYEWKNPGETAPRVKSGYLAYFEPWDIMVWASSYKAEFLSLLDMQAFEQSFAALNKGRDVFVLVLDPNGIVLAGKEAFPQAGAAESSALLKQVAESSKTLQDFSWQAPSGRIQSYTLTIPDTGWRVVVNSPESSYMGMVYLFRLIIVLTILFAGVLVSLMVRLLLNRILAPIRQIQELSTQATEGNLSGRLAIAGNDEIAKLSAYFNMVLETFAGLVETLQDAGAVLVQSTHSLGASTQEISSTANQQAASVKEILSTMEDSDKLSKGVAVRIQEVVKIATHTKDTVEKGFDLIRGSLEKMSEIRETNANTIGGIKTLGGQIETIWDIVNIINGIADQTKIIAFNAELEAAAAGDAGRNFQIVASEIRRLADGTVESTNEIRSKINEIQHASDKLIIASEEGTQRIREGWDISHNIRGVFEEVLSSSEISAASAGDIARAIQMQVASFEQIFLTLKMISEGIDNFVVSTRATSEASDQLKEIADQFNQTAARYTLGQGDANG